MAVADDILADDALWGEHADNLEAIMRRYYPQLFEAAYGASTEDYGLPVSFDLSNPRIKDVIDALATKVRNVSDTTREDIRRLVDAATEYGWSPSQLAEQIGSSVEIGTPERAMLISRTETANAYNTGSLLSYEDAGLTHVEVLDGDDDAECAAANGQTWTLEEANAEPIAHPNCVRAFSPVVGGE